MAERPTAEQITTAITEAAKKYKIDPRFAIAVAKRESGGNPDAMSASNAMGIMQLIPGTFADMKVGNDPWDYKQNIEAGVKYLGQQYAKYKDYSLAAAAYNAGPGRVKNKVPDIPETQTYVNLVMGLYNNGKEIKLNPDHDIRNRNEGKGAKTYEMLSGQTLPEGKTNIRDAKIFKGFSPSPTTATLSASEIKKNRTSILGDENTTSRPASSSPEGENLATSPRIPSTITASGEADSPLRRTSPTESAEPVSLASTFLDRAVRPVDTSRSAAVSAAFTPSAPAQVTAQAPAVNLFQQPEEERKKSTALDFSMDGQGQTAVPQNKQEEEDFRTIGGFEYDRREALMKFLGQLQESEAKAEGPQNLFSPYPNVFDERILALLDRSPVNESSK